MKITKAILAIATLTASVSVNAQRVSYNHDGVKQGQITVMEIGSGSLNPDLYYWATHNSYRKTAAQKNKQVFRTAAGINSYNQVEYAEAIDSALTKRAKIEALNVADRSVDLAWAAEGTKINSKMNDFQTNIDRIIMAGGSIAEKKQWEEYYNLSSCAIKSVKDGYMPNVQRKKMYLNIYAFVARKNNTLLKRLAGMQTAKETKELLATRLEHHSANKENIIRVAMQKWRKASGSRTNGSSSSGSYDESN